MLCLCASGRLDSSIAHFRLASARLLLGLNKDYSFISLMLQLMRNSVSSEGSSGEKHTCICLMYTIVASWRRAPWRDESRLLG